MRLLVLGGTAYLGRHVVEQALARGDEVTIFNRGRSAPGLFGGEVREVHGDRGGDLAELRGGSWDAAIDVSGFVPEEVEASSRLLSERVEHLTFVSTIRVYASLASPGVDETAPVVCGAEGYGPRKARCEEAARAAMDAGVSRGGATPASAAHAGATDDLAAREATAPSDPAASRCLVVRAGVIAGPYDATNRFTWWVSRLARGGRVLAPGPPDRPVQLIDARDLAVWMLEMAARREGGVFNAVGRQHTMAEVLEACGTDAPAELVWVGEDELLAAGIEPWSQLPLWIPSRDPEVAGFLAVDGSRAFAAGLRPRPLADTARDTLASLRREGEPSARGRTIREPGLDPAVEAQLIAGR